MDFVDLEKALDRMPRGVVWWTLKYWMNKSIVTVIKTMYQDATTRWDLADLVKHGILRWFAGGVKNQKLPQVLVFFQ